MLKSHKKSDELIVPPPSFDGVREGAKLVSVLHPQYVAGFIDGEGCFAISIGKHATLRQKREIKLEFEIELRADDRLILERIQVTLGCGRIYDLNYERYGWYPHVKYKISRLDDFVHKLIPFFRRYPLQAKKARSFQLFCQAVSAVQSKKHLGPDGLEYFQALQQQMRLGGKKQVTARVRENRLPSGVGRCASNDTTIPEPPVKAGKLVMPELPSRVTRQDQ